MQESPLCPEGTRGIGGLFARQLEHASLPGSALINCGLFSPDVRVWFGSRFGWKTNGDQYGESTRMVAVIVQIPEATQTNHTWKFVNMGDTALAL